MTKKVFRTCVVFAMLIITLVFGTRSILPSAPVTRAASRLSMLGADVSSLQRSEDLGVKYYYPNGVQGDALQILKDNGVNYIRLRVWVNPKSGYNNETKVLQFARAVKSKGLKLLLDFQYSDTWADPDHQTKPAAWANHTINQLQTDV